MSKFRLGETYRRKSSEKTIVQKVKHLRSFNLQIIFIACINFIWHISDRSHSLPRDTDNYVSESEYSL